MCPEVCAGHVRPLDGLSQLAYYIRCAHLGPGWFGFTPPRLTMSTTIAASFQGVPLSQLFPEQKEGWRGYIEWENEPKRKEIAARILKTKKFTPSPGTVFPAHRCRKKAYTSSSRIPARASPQDQSGPHRAPLEGVSCCPRITTHRRYQLANRAQREAGYDPSPRFSVQRRDAA